MFSMRESFFCCGCGCCELSSYFSFCFAGAEICALSFRVGQTNGNFVRQKSFWSSDCQSNSSVIALRIRFRLARLRGLLHIDGWIKRRRKVQILLAVPELRADNCVRKMWSWSAWLDERCELSMNHFMADLFLGPRRHEINSNQAQIWAMHWMACWLAHFAGSHSSGNAFLH